MRLPTLRHSLANITPQRRNGEPSEAPTLCRRVEKWWEVGAPHEGHTGSNVSCITITEQVCPCTECSALHQEGSHRTTAGEASVPIRILSLTLNLVYAYFIKTCLMSAHGRLIAREMGWCPSGPLPGFVLGLSKLGA